MLRDPAGKMGIPFISSFGLSVTDVRGNSSFFWIAYGCLVSGNSPSTFFPLSEVSFFQIFFRNVELWRWRVSDIASSDWLCHFPYRSIIEVISSLL